MHHPPPSPRTSPNGRLQSEIARQIIENTQVDVILGGGEEVVPGGSRRGVAGPPVIPIAGSDLKMVADWTTGGHTGAATPVTASGPGAQRLAGIIKNTDVNAAVLQAMGNRGR
jgi:alkaline phosphatase